MTYLVVALIRDPQSGVIDPASTGGAVIVGQPIEMMAAFAQRRGFHDIQPYDRNLHGRSISIADWLAFPA